MPHDACYHSVKSHYAVWPSARASQARQVPQVPRPRPQDQSRHKPETLAEEKWKEKKTGKPCGHAGPGTEYCRPTKKSRPKPPNAP